MSDFYPTADLKIHIPKALVSVLGGAIATFGIFVMMQKLIENDGLTVITPSEPVVIDPIFNIEDSDVREDKFTPKPKPQRKTLPPTTLLEPSDSKIESFLGPTSLTVELSKIEKSDLVGTNKNAESRPIVRVPPSYPAEAARNGIEGWVKLSFDVMPSGTVGNIQILDAQPKRTFDRAAKRALAKWKYRPSFENGEARFQSGLEVVLDFKLSEQ